MTYSRTNFNMAVAGSVVPALADRPIKNTIYLFDVDNTLTPARGVSPPFPSYLSLEPYYISWKARSRVPANQIVNLVNC